MLEQEKFEGQRSLIDAGRISTQSIVRFSEKDSRYKAILDAMQNVATELFEAYEQGIISSAHLRNGITETVRAFATVLYKKNGGPASTEVVTQLLVLRIYTIYHQKRKEDQETKEQLAHAL